MTKLGMNTTTAREVAGQVEGLGSALAAIDAQVNMARAMSMNPLNFMLNPGAMILSPVSITIAASVSADLANVQQTLDYLVLKLRQEAHQQDQVSNSLLPTDAGWFATAPTATAPDEIGIFERELEILGGVAFWGGLTLLARDLVDAADHWWTNLPPGVKKALPLVLKGGKFIPFVGVGFSLTSTIVEWDNDNVWGNTRNIIGTVIDGASVVAAVTLVPPLTPVGVVIEGGLLALGIAWDVMDLAWDTHDEGMWSWPWE